MAPATKRYAMSAWVWGFLHPDTTTVAQSPVPKSSVEWNRSSRSFGSGRKSSRRIPWQLTCLPLAWVLLRPSHSFVVLPATRSQSPVRVAVPSSEWHLSVRGEKSLLEPEDIAVGVTSVSLVETEPGIRLRCLEYYQENDVPSLDREKAESSIEETEDDHTSNEKVILLLHGFPDTPMTWNGVARSLVEGSGGENMLVVCPELRGYETSQSARSPVKRGIQAYSREKIVGDIDALRRHYCGRDQPLDLLVGHDWGGAVVWSVLEDQESHPSRITERAAILNLPHPVSFGKGIVAPKQLLKSWYMFFFQVPFLSEWFLSRNEGEYLRHSVVPYLPISGEEETTPRDAALQEHYERVLARPGFIDGPLAYYRAAAAGLWGSYGAILPSYPAPVAWLVRGGRALLRAWHGVSGGKEDSDGKSSPAVVKAPVLVLWGSRDPYLGQALAHPPRDLVPNLRGPVFYPTAGHWVHWDDERGVGDELRKFLLDNPTEGHPRGPSQTNEAL